MQVSGSFNWAVLDIRLPWQSAPDSGAVSTNAGSGFPFPPMGVSSATFGPAQADGTYFPVDGEAARQALLCAGACA